MESVVIKGDNSLAMYLTGLTTSMRPKIMSALHELGPYMEDKVKDKFGTYQSGWPKLKRASVIAKYNKRAQVNGFKRANFKRLTGLFNLGFGDDPLVLHGNLRNSIKNEVNDTELKLIVYTDEKYAAVQEYGHKNVPARSFMRLTLWAEEDHIVKTISSKVGEII